MKYQIIKPSFGCKQLIDIPEAEYRAIKAARNNLTEILFIEQKLDIITENYLEYEMELLASSTRQMLFGNQDWAWFQKEINIISRRIVNLLTACKLYLDQSIHHLSNIYGKDSDKVVIIRNQMAAEYDSQISYRIMEALRNHVQHRGLPVHECTYNAKRIGDISKSQILFTLTPYIDPQKLEDKKFKSSVREEMKNLGDKIDIKPLVRDYIASIGNIQDKVREVLKDDISLWENKLTNAIDRFKNEFKLKDPILGLSITTSDEQDSIQEEVSIFTEFIDHRKDLERKNQNFKALASRFVTSQILGNSETI